MTKYPFDEHVRVAVLDAVASLSSPSVVELEGGTDVTCDLTPSGLSIPRSTGEVDRTPWGADQTRAQTTRWTTAVQLTAFRHAQPVLGDLRSVIDFGAPVVLAVRYGVRWDVGWEAGQEVEMIRGEWAKPSTAPASPDQAVTFTVGIVVFEDDDNAVVVDP